MPMATSRLTKKSGKAEVRAAVSACIREEMHGGKPQDQATAMCLEDARSHAGSRYIPKRVKVK